MPRRAAGALAPGWRGIIEIRKVYGFLEFVRPVSGKKDPGHVRFEHQGRRRNRSAVGLRIGKKGNLASERRLPMRTNCSSAMHRIIHLSNAHLTWIKNFR